MISIGGVDDENTFTRSPGKLYQSTYGRTVDGLMKPELLPTPFDYPPRSCGHPRARRIQSAACHPGSGDADIRLSFTEGTCKTQLGEENRNCADTAGIRKLIVHRIQQCKYISPDYMHVDGGTSFAAPIVCAVIAQLLGPNHRSPRPAIRNTLFLYGNASGRDCWLNGRVMAWCSPGGHY